MHDSERQHTVKSLINAIEYRLPKGYPMVVAVCIVVGLVTGLATHLMNLLLRFIAVSVNRGFGGTGGVNYYLIILPVAGLLLSVAYTRWIVRLPLSHGTERIRSYLKEKNYKLPPRLMWASMVGSSVTLGFGGSAGAEGPSAYTGSAIASNIGRLCGFDDNKMRIMVGIGAGAGIAGIFRSPIGGVLFTLEVLGMPLTTLPILALIVACLASGISSYLLAGQHFDVSFFNSVKPEGHEYWTMALLGIVCGLYAIYYTFTFKRTGAMLEKLRNPWLRALAGGLMVGVAVFTFPTLYATGYDYLDSLLVGEYKELTYNGPISAATEALSRITGASANVFASPMLLVAIASGIIFAKGFACSATNFGGGIAGNFAPTLFAGGFVGFIFATLANHWLGLGLHVPNYIFLGMAGAMSGIIEAPLMAIFLTAEMADRSDFLWPLSIVALLSWGTRRMLGRRLPSL